MGVILIGFRPGILTDAEVTAIQAAAPGRQLVITDDRAAQEALLPQLEIVAGPVRPSVFLRAPGLRWFQGWGAGADWLVRHPEAIERDLIVTNTSGIHAVQLSEHILAFILIFARQFHRAARHQAARKWVHPENDEVFELPGKTLLLLGVGAIGERTAKLASAFGLRVIGVRRDPAIGAPGVERMEPPSRLHDLLPDADFVVVVLPHTTETHHMIGEQELRLMKSGAFLINVGRGKLIDPTALIATLQEGRLGGAGLDVFEEEPLPADSPLWTMPNVVITAHYAGISPDYDRRAAAIFIENLQRYAAGQPLRHVVDKRLGY